MFPQHPSKGQRYKQWIWDGHSWRCADGGGGGGGGGGGTFIGPNPPTGPQAGQLWFNTTSNTLFVYDGSAWIAAGANSGNVTVAATAPTNPLVGDFWFNTGNDFLMIWDGASWQFSSVDALTVVAATAPTPAVDGMLWHNTTNGILYVYNGTSWIVAHPVSTTAGTQPPANPSPGDFWWNTSNAQMYVFDGNNWIDTTLTAPAAVGGINYVGAAAPSSPSIGELWYNTTNDTLSIWDGTSWLAAPGITGPQGPPGPFPDAPLDGNNYGRQNGAWVSGGTFTNAVKCNGTATIYPGELSLAPGLATLEVAGLANDVAIFASNGSTSFVTQYTRVAQFDIEGDAQVYLEMTINNNSNLQLMGQIAIQPGLTGVLYQSVSDERLKEDHKAIVNSGDVIDALKPITFKWKGAKSKQELHGFSAQELHRVCPEAVTQGHGKPGDKKFKPWMSDNSKLVPLLVAEIQDLRKRLEKLEKK